MNNNVSMTSFGVLVREYLLFILIFIQGAIVLLVTIYYLYPSYQEIQANRREIQEKDAELRDLSDYARYLAELADSTLDVEEEIVHYALPSENDVVTLIVTYEGLAKDDRVDVSPISLSPGVLEQEEVDTENQRSGLQEVIFEMDVVAEDQEAANDYIQSVVNTRRVFDILSLSWDVTDAETADVESNEVSLSLSLATYYYIPSGIGSSQSLVEQGQEQEDFVSRLEGAIVFEDLLLTDVEVGKQDLFERAVSENQSGSSEPDSEESESEVESDDEEEANDEEIDEAFDEEDFDAPVSDDEEAEEDDEIEF